MSRPRIPRQCANYGPTLHRAKPAATDDIDKAAIGLTANRAGLAMILDYCTQQRLLPRALSLDEIFSETATVLGIDVAS